MSEYDDTPDGGSTPCHDLGLEVDDHERLGPDSSARKPVRRRLPRRLMANRRTRRVYLDGHPIGAVEQTPQGAPGFAYDDDYRRDPQSTPLSLSLSLPLAADR
jgi:HipA N-terminal domain